MTTRHSDHPQIMSIAQNKAKHTQQYDNYLISNAIMFGETFTGVMESDACSARDYAQKCSGGNSGTVWHSNIDEQKGKFATVWFSRGLFEGEKIGIMKSYIHYSFVFISLFLTRNSPSNCTPMRNQIIYGSSRASLHFHFLLFSGVWLLKVKRIAY